MLYSPAQALPVYHFFILSLFLTSEPEDASVQNFAREIQDNDHFEEADSIKTPLNVENFRNIFPPLPGGMIQKKE